MADHDAIIEPASATIERGGSKAGWFAVGALTATLVFGLFLFVNNYLWASATPAAAEPALIIEGQ